MGSRILNIGGTGARIVRWKTSSKALLKRLLPASVFANLYALYNGDALAALSFVLKPCGSTAIQDRWRLARSSFRISQAIPSPHTHAEIFTFMREILGVDPGTEGVIIEAGCFKGSSTAKFSLAAALAGRRLVVFDSFEGIPENSEPKGKTLFGTAFDFKKGDYASTLPDTMKSIRLHGAIEVCDFVKGWFEDTLPAFESKICAAYIDVDLAESTKTCLRYLYPLLEPGGVLVSQDGHLPLVLDVFENEGFWRDEVGCERPGVEGIGTSKVLVARKPRG